MPLDGWESVDRSDSDYKACVALMTAGGAVIGTAVGALASVPTGGTSLLAGPASGALWGFVAGYLACPYLAPAVRRKIEAGSMLTDSEVRSAADAMSTYAGVGRASEAVRLLSMVRGSAHSSGAKRCVDPRSVAHHLLGA